MVLCKKITEGLDTRNIGENEMLSYSTGLLDSVESRISHSELSYVQESY